MREQDFEKARIENSRYINWLQYSYAQGMMSLDEMQEMTSMKEKEIIKAHETNYSVWKGSGKDQRWITRLPDGRKVAKKRREDLEKCIVDFYLRPDGMTLADLYVEWISYKKIEARASSYIAKIKSDWRTYYKSNPAFISKRIRDLGVIDIEVWANGMIKKYGMDKKTYYNTSMIARQALKYAKKKGYIDKSPFEDAEINTRLFKKEKKAQSESQVYTEEEQERMEEEMLRFFNEKPEYTAPLAIILLFYTGLRCGELVALKTTDIEGDYIHVQRQETRAYEDVDAEHSKMTGYEVVENTKSDAGDRYVPIVPYAAEILSLVQKTNETYGFKDGDYLFVHGDKRINHGAIDGRIVDACERLSIKRKTAHKFRKTYISTLYDSGVPLEAIRKIVGHEDDRTTLRNYCFNRLTKDQTFEKVEKALEKPAETPEKESVTGCDTKVVSFPQNKKSGASA